MTLTIELPPQQEAILRAQAAQAGIPVERYALDLLLRGAEEDRKHDDTKPRLSAFNRLVECARSQPDRRAVAGLPPIDLSVPRADLYGYTEREDAQR